MKLVDAEKETSKKVNVAAIVVPIVVVVVVVILFVFLRMYICRRLPRKQKEPAEVNNTVSVPKPRVNEMMI